MKDFRTKINYRKRDYLIRRKMFIKNKKHSQENLIGVLMNAFKYDAQPHGGIAFGFDRMVMIFAGEKSIRDTIAFPQTKCAVSLMDDSPTKVSEEQFTELHIKTGEE